MTEYRAPVTSAAHAWLQSISALAVVLITVAIATIVYWQTEANQRDNMSLQEAQLMPYLVIDRIPGDVIGYQITNAGTGPAIIQRVVFFENGVAVAELYPGDDPRFVDVQNAVMNTAFKIIKPEVLRKAYPAPNPINVSISLPRPGNAIPPGDSRSLIQVNNQAELVVYARENNLTDALNDWELAFDIPTTNLVIQYGSVSERTCRQTNIFGRTVPCKELDSPD